MVIAVADAEDAFELIQHAMNFAEQYQIPVILLSEKVIAETVTTVPPFAQNTIPIERGLVTGKDLEKLENTDRYKITESGLSKRWIPGSSDAYFFANGDEHKEDGTLDESAAAGEMYAKRCRKIELIKAHTPEPVIIGETAKAAISFVGWGSTKNTLRDIVKIYEAKGIKVNYLHFSYMWPLQTDTLEKFFADNKNVHLVEGNYDGQLGGLINKHTDLKFVDRLLKWNGRPFFIEDLETYINNNT